MFDRPHSFCETQPLVDMVSRIQFHPVHRQVSKVFETIHRVSVTADGTTLGYMKPNADSKAITQGICEQVRLRI